MKRYLVFGGTRYYPIGGWEEFRGDFDEFGPAKEAALAHGGDWSQVVDTTLTGDDGLPGKVVWDYMKDGDPQQEYHVHPWPAP